MPDLQGWLCHESRIMINLMQRLINRKKGDNDKYWFSLMALLLTHILQLKINKIFKKWM